MVFNMKSELAQLLIAGVTGVAISAAVMGTVGRKLINKIDNIGKEQLHLIAEAKQKAAGEDNDLSRGQAKSLARSLGYKEVINDQHPIDLVYIWPRIYLENGRTRVPISEDRIRQYLAE